MELERLFSMEEVHGVVFGMDEVKALGPHGYSVVFPRMLGYS